MKNVLKSFVICLILIFTLQVCVQADMGVPGIIFYNVKITNPNGTEYVDYDGKVKGTLEYGREVTINYETTINGKEYGAFALEEGSYDFSNFVCFEDVDTVEDMYVSENLNVDEPAYKVVVAEDGVKIHTGPGYGYETVGEIIPRGTEIVCYSEENSYDNPWYYTDYKGQKGWVCELDSLGEYKENSYITIGEVSLNKKDEEGLPQEIDKIPEKTIIKNPVLTDPWTQSYYVKYNDNWGYISNDSFMYENEDIIIYEVPNETIIYDNYPVEYVSESFEEIGRIPAGTKIAIKYADYNGIHSYISYNGIQGWINEFDYSKEIETVKTTDLELPNLDDFTEIEVPKIEVKEVTDEESEETDVVEKEDVTVSENQGETANSEVIEEKEIAPEQIVTSGVVIAIVIALTCVVSIILINKKSKKTEEKENSEDKEEKENK